MIESNTLKQQIRVLFKLFFYQYQRSGFCNLICCKAGLNVGGIKNHFRTRSAATLQNKLHVVLLLLPILS